MRIQLGLIGLLLLGSSCDGVTTVGDGGVGGAAATGGQPQSGNGAGHGAVCVTGREPFAIELLYTTGQSIQKDVSARVKVLEIARCADVSCPQAGHLSTDPGSRLRVLLSDPTQTSGSGPDSGVADGQWTLLLQAPGLPEGLLQVGDEYDLTAAVVEQTAGTNTMSALTVGMVQAGEPVLIFARNWQRLLSLPSLDAWGLKLETGAVSCEDPKAPNRGVRQYAVRVTHEAENVSVARGEQGQLGALTIANVRYDTVVDWSSFDGRSYFELAMYRLPP